MELKRFLDGFRLTVCAFFPLRGSEILHLKALVHCGESPYIPSMSFPLSLSPRKRGAGIQGIETDPGFRVFARNDNAANSRKEKNMYAL